MFSNDTLYLKKKSRQEILLEHVSGLMKGQKAIRNSQQEFTTRKVCQSNLIWCQSTSCNQMIRFVDKGIAAGDIQHLDDI